MMNSEPVDLVQSPDENCIAHPRPPCGGRAAVPGGRAHRLRSSVLRQVGRGGVSPLHAGALPLRLQSVLLHAVPRSGAPAPGEALSHHAALDSSAPDPGEGRGAVGGAEPPCSASGSGPHSAPNPWLPARHAQAIGFPPDLRALQPHQHAGPDAAAAPRRARPHRTPEARL